LAISSRDKHDPRLFVLLSQVDRLGVVILDGVYDPRICQAERKAGNQAGEEENPSGPVARLLALR
jgi:hypothetical protein